MFDFLIKNINSNNLHKEKMQNYLKLITIEERQEISLLTKTMVHYYDDEVITIKTSK
jgi:hypothetical protein